MIAGTGEPTGRAVVTSPEPIGEAVVAGAQLCWSTSAAGTSRRVGVVREPAQLDFVVGGKFAFAMVELEAANPKLIRIALRDAATYDLYQPPDYLPPEFVALLADGHYVYANDLEHLVRIPVRGGKPERFARPADTVRRPAAGRPERVLGRNRKLRRPHPDPGESEVVGTPRRRVRLLGSQAGVRGLRRRNAHG